MIMKGWLTGIVAVLALVTAGVVSAQTRKGPQMTFETTAHDFGDIARKGGNVSCTFEFVNDGDAPLVIKRIITSCTCTKAEYSKRPIEPGQKSVIRIVYEPRKKEAGVFHKVIQIFTNAEESRKIVTVSGNSIDAKKL